MENCQQLEEDIPHAIYLKLLHIDEYKARQKLHPIEFQIYKEFYDKYITRWEKKICKACILMIQLLDEKVNKHAI